MGGNAFKALLPTSPFPRIPTPLYKNLKAQLLAALQPLYAHVAVPPEVPDKTDHGDLDFVVAGAAAGLAHDTVKAAVRATHSIALDGCRPSHFAVPLAAFGAGAGGAYLQVDVNVVEDAAQLARVALYNSYGGLGNVLGVLSQTQGLSFSLHGLKLAEPIPTSPPQTYFLTRSYPAILAFFGLAHERWAAGFARQDDVYAWVAASRFAPALATQIARDRASVQAPGRHRGGAITLIDRFVAHIAENVAPEAAPPTREARMRAALAHFGKTREYEALLLAARVQEHARAVLSGTLVTEWTGVLGMPVRFIMDEVKERVARAYAGPADADADEFVEIPTWRRALMDMSLEEVRDLVRVVKDEMQADGRLEFDWKAAKAAKAEQKKLTETQAVPIAVV